MYGAWLWADAPTSQQTAPQQNWTAEQHQQPEPVQARLCITHALNIDMLLGFTGTAPMLCMLCTLALPSATQPVSVAADDDGLEQRLAALRRAKGATPDGEGAKAKKRAPPSSTSSSKPGQQDTLLQHCVSIDILNISAGSL